MANDHGYAAMVQEAIGRSISHNEIVTLETNYLGVRSDLLGRCDDSASSASEDGRLYEYWGVEINDDGEGENWRVHVLVTDPATRADYDV